MEAAFNMAIYFESIKACSVFVVTFHIYSSVSCVENIHTISEESEIRVSQASSINA
jgi:hypothetical protein